jgi:GntR family transcriptional regulator, carbon starvation induced regulator
VTTATGKPTLVDEVHEAIYQALIDGQIEPGSKLKLSEIAGNFRVSAAVVREALSRLTEQGLCSPTPSGASSSRRCPLMTCLTSPEPES